MKKIRKPISKKRSHQQIVLVFPTGQIYFSSKTGFYENKWICLRELYKNYVEPKYLHNRHFRTMRYTIYNEMIEKDVELLKTILSWIKCTPWLESTLSQVISKKPWHDICSIIWYFSAFGVLEFGRKHFWIVAMNLVIAYVLRVAIKASRPVEIDSSLMPQSTDTNAESYGFPSLESYLGVVIMGHIFFSLKYLIFLPLALIVIAIVGLSRVYSRARFPHQIIGSWILGLVGLGVCWFFTELIELHKMSTQSHNLCLAFFFCCMLCNFALSMEDNSSRIFFMKKSEYVRVIRHIMVSDQDTDIHSAENLQGDGASGSGLFSATLDRLKSPRRAAMDEALNRKNPRDSFFYLQRSLMRREEEKQRGAANGMNSSSMGTTFLKYRGAHDELISSDSERFTRGSYAT